MSLSPSTLPRAARLVHVRAPRSDRADPALREPLARLGALDAPLARQAAALGLLLTPHSDAEREAFAAFARALPQAAQLLEDIASLPPHHRLPWFEHFARALAGEAVAARHGLIDASRRMMTADGIVTRMDQLRWVALRHLMHGSASAAPAAATHELDALDDTQLQALGVFSAFLSHLVPAPELTLDLSDHDGPSPGQLWYDAVLAPWQDRSGLPPREGHDIDAVLRALRVLQSLPWLQRPVLVRAWFDAARVLTEGPQLQHDAADALRLASGLLDSPLPPELAQQYVEVTAP